MSKASQGIKLIKWLANQADDVVASADDLKRFGPQAAKVRALLDFTPTMSDDAARVSNDAYEAAYNARDPAVRSTYNAAFNAGRNAGDVADNIAYVAARIDAYRAAITAPAAAGVPDNVAMGAARDAGGAESISNFIDPNTYRILTNPLAAGRAVDILGSRPRNQGLPFYDVVRQMGKQGAINNPRDVVVASRLAKSPKEILETALTLMSDGMSAEDAMRAARLL